MYEEVISRFVEEIRTSPSQEISIKSKLFWKQLGVRRRTPTTIKRVKKEFQDAGIKISLLHFEGEFGKEPKDFVQIILRHYPIFKPDDAWFESMASKEYESEMEIQVFFIKPLFLALGYEEDDFSYDRKIPFKVQSDKFTKRRPDVVLYNGSSRIKDDALVVIEAKKCVHDPQKNAEILGSAKEEAKGYRSLFECKICVATDGHSLIVFDHTKSHKRIENVFHRSQLKDQWAELFMLLSKQALVNEKG